MAAALGDWALRDRAAGLRLFVSEARAPAAGARIALGFTLRESAWMGSDPSVNAAKHGWWVEELAMADRGAARHPLTRSLAQEDTRIDFSRLARTLLELRAAAPEVDESGVLDLVREMEHALWFGPGAAERGDCTIRARAALVDVLERTATRAADAQHYSRAIAIHDDALRAATTTDAWTAARREQALWRIESVGAADGYLRRWGEVMRVWRAVRLARRLAGSRIAQGAESGT